MRRPLVILESPFAGDVGTNILYARLALRDSLLRGESPIASHLLYTQDNVLNDNVPQEREYGIEAGLAWLGVVDKSVVYVDRGITSGMMRGIKRAKSMNKPVELRSLALQYPHLVTNQVPLNNLQRELGL